MTTIAYKQGVVACDSRKTCGCTIVDDDFNKCYEHEGVRFFVAGSVGDVPKLVAGWLDPSAPEADANAIVADAEGGLWFVGSTSEGHWRCSIDREKCYSIGSGSDHAWTAMDMGASAADAVRMAARRDTGTGGTIREFSV